VVAFLASASKVTGFFVLARVFLEGGAVEGSFVRPALWGVAALSMVVGTFFALTQHNIKRMLAYSGIAHAGYILMAFVSAGPQALSVVLTYVMIYAIMSVGAFSVLSTVEAAGGSPDRRGLTGLGRRSPALAFSLAVFMVSLTGIPPAAGFIAKFALFREVLASGQLALVLIAVTMSVVSVGFYLRLLVPVFMAGDGGAAPGAGIGDSKLRAAPEGVVVAVLLAAAILVLGVLPQLVLSFAGLISS
jgi:NADH-quinone oxidoreductase subunit N